MLESQIPRGQLLDLAGVIERLDGQVTHRAPNIREPDVATDAVQERHPKGPLEPVNGGAHRTLRQTQRVGGGGHVLALRHAQEDVKLIQCDAGAAPTTRRRTRVAAARSWCSHRSCSTMILHKSISPAG